MDTLDTDATSTPNPLIELIRSRRSVRRFTADPVPEAFIRQILQAAVSGPDAGNLRSPALVLCRDSALNRELGALNHSAPLKEWPDYQIEWEDGTSTSLESEAKNARDAFYGAPVVATIFGPDGYSFATEDATCMAMDILLACHALGLGACYITRAHETFSTPRGLEIKRSWNIADDYIGKMHIAIGFPDGVPQHVKDPDYNHLLVLVDQEGAHIVEPEYLR